MNTRLMVLLAGACLGAEPVGARAAESPQPKIVVDALEYRFGVLEVGVAGHHEFTVSNAGTAPLVLQRGKSSCGCCTCVCTMKLPDGPILPGQSAKVRLEWISKVYTGPYRQTETLLTNDPASPEVKLYVIGRYGSPVRTVPESLVFSRVLSGESVAGQMRLYCYADKPLEIAGWQWVDSAAAGRFQVAFDRLSAEQLREEPGATSGYLVRVTVGPGLPLGPFRQQLALTTNLQSARTVTISIQGEVTEPISIVGRNWDGRNGVLRLGTVDGRQGGEWPLVLVAQGQYAKGVRFQPAQITPSWLEVKLGPTVFSPDKTASRTPLVIRIPPGTRPASHVATSREEAGRIVLRTNHPHLPELAIEVRFAVTPVHP